jgi:hypothetical protein
MEFARDVLHPAAAMATMKTELVRRMMFSK